MLATARWFTRPNLAIVGGLFALTYVVILGEAGQRDPQPIIRILNAAAAGTLILIYLVTVPNRADRVDRGVLLGLLLFAAAAVLAQFPRQAFDAVLAALLFTAALFVARTLVAVEAGRVAFVRCLIALSALLTFLTAAGWLTPALEWWSLTGWSVIPPLDLNLPAMPWGHRHDLTLLIVMLYPSWWVGRIGPLRAAMATVVGILTLLIVLVDGSRNLWLGMAVASAALFVPFAVRHWPRDRRRQTGVGLALAAGAAAIALSGIAGSVLQRLLTAESIEARLAMWGSLTDAWLSKPVAGYGPGSFPWLLQLTNYFDTNSFAPRHPDSVIFQLLPEAGLLGAAALLVVVVTLLPAIIRGRSMAASWVLIIFALAGLGANPTDFGFLVAVAIGWVAFAIPRVAVGQVAEPAGRRLVRFASLAIFAIGAGAWTATAVADISYQSARSAINAGRIDEAIRRLELASTLDPGMALYKRQLATAQLLIVEVPAAIQNLEIAVNLNPSDDLAWRVLALAESASGDSDSAWAALERAIETQRSDTTNLLLRARWQIEDGHHEEALATLGEVVQAWPEIVAAPGWAELLPPTISTLDVIEVAMDRWSRGLPSPEPRSLQPLLLAVMAGRSEVAQASADEMLGPSLGAAYLDVMRCAPSASVHLEEAPDQVRRTYLYWSLVARQSLLDGEVDGRAERLFEIMARAPLFSAPMFETLNPLNENGEGGYSADIWGYRRSPITWPDYEQLPSGEAGAARWLVEPREAVHSADLETVLPRCT
ncbi:MAG: O-antigen ligase family protein [Candidatus Limnocylindria bacterium]